MWKKDLIVLGADADVLTLIKVVILDRSESLGVRSMHTERADFLKDVLHDASPPENVAGLLRGFSRTHQRALVVRDLEGSGFEDRGAPELEKAITDALGRTGWSAERVEAVVIEPELERWLRFDSPHLAQVIRDSSRASAGWQSNHFRQKVAEIIAQTGGLENQKPIRPKEAFERILSAYRIPRSAKLYQELAERESLKGCTVTSFCKMVAALQKWFPNEP